MKRLYGEAVHGSTRPWWTEEAPLDEAAPPLGEEIEADVTIVGGGFTGLWTALSVLERTPEARVVIVEALRCGDGASGRNGGFLHGYWSSLPRLLDLLGAEGALELARSGDGMFDAVRALGEDVWLRESGMLMVSTCPAHDAVVRRAVEVAEQLGVPEQALFVDAGDVSVRSPAFGSAVHWRDGATVQPARLVRALRRAVLRAGARLYEGTPALSVDAGRVVTAGGAVRTREIVLGTNAAAARWPANRRLAVFRSAIVLTEPVPDLTERIGWEDGAAVFDGRTYLDYFRPTNDGRVLMGSASGEPARAEHALRTLFPALRDVRISHRWEGAIDVSSDRFPFVATVPGTRVHYAAGFTGNGVGPTWIAGGLLASLALGDEAISPLARREPAVLPPEPLRSLGARLVRSALLAIDDAECAGKRPPATARAFARLPELVGLRVASR
ncbi:MAG TPA: FAD-binding oxidoreductase [Gaiellaceae bacterium]|nr:FAD-binding oxidoreductase [Gaiellaceae bacterium]